MVLDAVGQAASLRSATKTVTAAAGAAVVCYHESLTMLALVYYGLVLSMTVPMLWLAIPLTLRYRIAECLTGLLGLVDRLVDGVRTRLCNALRAALDRRRR